MKSSPPEPDYFELQNGNVYTWPEAGSSVMLKSVTKGGDPVELSAGEARELAEKLLVFAKRVE